MADTLKKIKNNLCSGLKPIKDFKEPGNSLTKLRPGLKVSGEYSFIFFVGTLCLNNQVWPNFSILSSVFGRLLVTQNYVKEGC